MKRVVGEYEIDDAIERIDFAAVHGWLSGSYWSPGISREKVERAARHSSLVLGAYCGGFQVGYARVISDCATFGWLADVFIDDAHRGKGLARELVRFALAHPEHQGFRRWMLATRDAHGVYAEVGFEPMDKPELLMIHRPIPSWETGGG